jgi:hypothetical protein
MKKILYLILHTNKQSDRYYHLVDTWLSGKDFIFYSDHEDLDNNIIKVTDNDSYHSNEPKFVSVVNNLPEKYLDYEWYFFVDNDTFVNTKKLESMLDTFDTNVLHGQRIYCWPKDKSMPYLSGGAGMLVHHTKYQHMRENFRNYSTGYSDVSLGYYMKEYGIECVDDGVFWSQPPSFYNIELTDVKNYISFHYIKDKQEMVRLYKSCMS